MSNNKHNTFLRNSLSTMTATGVGLVTWFPAMARCIFREANFTKPDFQTLYHNYFSLAANKYNYRSIIQNNYRGIGPFAVAIVGYPAIVIGNEKLSSALADNNDNGEITIKQQLLSSSIIGATSALFYNPLKASVVAMQNNNLSIGNSFRYIAQNYGMPGFYRGTSFYMARNATYCSCMLMPTQRVIDWFVKSVLGKEPDSTAGKNGLRIAKYGIAATIATTISMPFDVFSTMACTDPLRRKYITNADIMKTAFKTRGMAGFFIGYKYRLFATGTEFAVFDQTKPFFDQLFDKINF
jgi:hypothetical protein